VGRQRHGSMLGVPYACLHARATPASQPAPVDRLPFLACRLKTSRGWAAWPTTSLATAGAPPPLCGRTLRRSRAALAAREGQRSQRMGVISAVGAVHEAAAMPRTTKGGGALLQPACALLAVPPDHKIRPAFVQPFVYLRQCQPGKNFHNEPSEYVHQRAAGLPSPPRSGLLLLSICSGPASRSSRICCAWSSAARAAAACAAARSASARRASAAVGACAASSVWVRGREGGGRTGTLWLPG
jgi:hypothetical protein